MLPGRGAAAGHRHGCDAAGCQLANRLWPPARTPCFFVLIHAICWAIVLLQGTVTAVILRAVSSPTIFGRQRADIALPFICSTPLAEQPASSTQVGMGSCADLARLYSICTLYAVDMCCTCAHCCGHMLLMSSCAVPVHTSEGADIKRLTCD